MPLSAGRHLAARLSDAGFSINWRRFMPGTLCGFVGGGRDHAKQEKHKQTKKVFTKEKKCSSEGLTDIVYNIGNITANTPTFGFVRYDGYKKRAWAALRIHQCSCVLSSWRRRRWQTLLRP